MRKHGPYGKALSDLMDWLGEDDEFNAKKILRTGRRFWCRKRTVAESQVKRRVRFHPDFEQSPVIWCLQ